MCLVGKLHTVLIELLLVPLKLSAVLRDPGALDGGPGGLCPSLCLQLGVPVNKTCTLGLQCLPFPPECPLYFAKNSVDPGQRAGKGRWKDFLRRVGPESPARDLLQLLCSR